MTGSRRALPIAAAAAALAGYLALVWWDVLPRADYRYAPPALGGLGLHPAHWWDEFQGLRGWGWNNPLGHSHGWFYFLNDPGPFWRRLPLVAVLAAGAVFVVRAVRRGRGGSPRAAVAVVGIVWLAQLAGMWVHDSNPSRELTYRTAYRPYAGYLVAADRTDAGTLFSGYAATLRRHRGDSLCPIHCGTHPPGPIIAFWLPIQAVEALPQGAQRDLRDALAAALHSDGGQQLSAAGATVALAGGPLMLLLGALIVLPLFGLARRLGAPELALPLAALGALAPALLHFVPTLDSVLATGAAALLYVALRGLTAPVRPLLWGLATGGLLAALTYASLGLAVMVLPLLVVLAAVRPPRARALRWLGGLVAGAAVPWLAVWVIGGLDVPGMLSAAAANHRYDTLGSRPYGVYTLLNLTEFAQLAGLPLIAAVLAVTLRRRGRPWNPYGLAFLGTVLLLDLSGTVRGETGRIWMFLLPLATMALSVAAGQRLIGARQIAWLAAAQAAVAVVLNARWKL